MGSAISSRLNFDVVRARRLLRRNAMPIRRRGFLRFASISEGKSRAGAASWHSVEKRIKEYMIAFLLLEVVMVGIFVALDIVLFYVRLGRVVV